MKIATPDVQFSQQMRQVYQTLGHQISHVILALPHAIHAQQRRPHHFLALLLDQAGPYDDVDVSGFVLQGD